MRCITYYETKRGLLAVNATRQLFIFDRLRQNVAILFLDDLRILEIAAEIHANLKRRGRPIQDADILIAATAIARSLTLISNDSDVLNIQDLRVEN